MGRKPIGDRALSPAERQARRRTKLKIQRRQIVAERLAQPLPYSPELDQLRTNIGRVSQYLAGMGDPTSLAHVLIELDGPLLPYPAMAGAAIWLARFAESYRYAAIARQALLAEMAEPDTNV